MLSIKMDSSEILEYHKSIYLFKRYGFVIQEVAKSENISDEEKLKYAMMYIENRIKFFTCKNKLINKYLPPNWTYFDVDISNEKILYEVRIDDVKK